MLLTSQGTAEATTTHAAQQRQRTPGSNRLVTMAFTAVTNRATGF